MPDFRNTLQAMFEERNRFDNFGNLLIGLQVKGFRCHTDTRVDFRSPVTAFCGLNGTGKSTLLQLAAVSRKNTAGRTYYIRDFLVVGTLDPAPFAANARVKYSLWRNDRSSRTISLGRRPTRWSGYGRRPRGPVFFAGVGLYLPRIERRDFVIRNAANLTVNSSSAVSGQVTDATSKVLGRSYDAVTSNFVEYTKRSGKVLSVERKGAHYSEAHMGCGEGRAHFLVETLESLPDRSLVLIEEPETSLHPSAQYEFGKYLMEVSVRKRHQIIVTTHSEFLLQALPAASRLYLHACNGGIRAVPGLGAAVAKSLMADGHAKALRILVEDQCAQAILEQMIARIDPLFLRSLSVYAAGDARTIRAALAVLSSSDSTLAAVRDGDQREIPSENLFKLPGDRCPEREMFESQAVQEHVLSKYGVSLQDFLASNSDVDVHEWLPRLARQLGVRKETLLAEFSRQYSYGIPEREVAALVTLLKAACQ